jgi:hypothetical protein
LRRYNTVASSLSTAVEGHHRQSWACPRHPIRAQPGVALVAAELFEAGRMDAARHAGAQRAVLEAVAAGQRGVEAGAAASDGLPPHQSGLSTNDGSVREHDRGLPVGRAHCGNRTMGSMGAKARNGLATRQLYGAGLDDPGHGAGVDRHRADAGQETIGCGRTPH